MAIAFANSFLLSNNLNLNTGNTSFTTGAFTPTNNSLLIIYASWFGEQVATPGTVPTNITISANTGLGGWVNQVANGWWDAPPSYDYVLTVFTVPIATGTAMTITQSGYKVGGGSMHYSCHGFCVTGYNTTTPVGAKASANVITAGSMSITLSGTPVNTSLILAGTGWIPQGSGALSANGAGWTKVYNDFNGALCTQDQWIIGSTSTTVPWANQCSGDGVVDALVRQFAIEIQVATAAAGNPGIMIGL